MNDGNAPGPPDPQIQAHGLVPVDFVPLVGAPTDPRIGELPKIAEKADDLEAIKKAVEDAASVGGGLWFSYLFVLFYLAVAAGAVTHADLFFEKPVKLPFLGVELPLLAFFLLAPWLFLAVHGYTLVHLALLTDKARRFYQALHEQLGDRADLPGVSSERRAGLRDGIERQLPSNVFVQFLAGPRTNRRGAFGGSLRAIGWITLAIGPVLLLLLFQLQFLPYHSHFITWSHRAALLLDFALIWWLWRKILSGREIDRPRRRLSRFLWNGAGLAVTVCVLVLSFGIATFSGEWQEQNFAAWKVLPEGLPWAWDKREDSPPGSVASIRDWATRSPRVSAHEWIFESRIDYFSRRRLLPFSSTLVLSGANALESLGIEDPDKLKWKDFIFRARGRDLRGAEFALAIMARIDFDGADLRAASFSFAQLDRASFDGAQLQGAVLNHAQIGGATLFGAQLQGASLFEARLHGAVLQGAMLQGASLYRAQLQAAWLVGAQLQGASLADAQLQGASLDFAQLQGASLNGAQLQGASLSFTSLEATDFENVMMWKSYGKPGVARDLQLLPRREMWAPYWKHRLDVIPSEIISPWDEQAFAALRKLIDQGPEGPVRDYALARIEALDCATAGACDPSAPASKDEMDLRTVLEDGAKGGEGPYRKTLAKTLRDLVCPNQEGAPAIARAGGFRTRLDSAGPDGAALKDEMTNKDSKTCPVAAVLTDDDRAALRVPSGPE